MTRLSGLRGVGAHCGRSNRADNPRGRLILTDPVGCPKFEDTPAASFAESRPIDAPDDIWRTENVSALEERYKEVLSFFRAAGLLQVPISSQAREPLANLIHLLQSEIRAGRITNLTAARQSRAKAEGYWYICDLEELVIRCPRDFAGKLRVKPTLGGEILTFNQATLAYELTDLAEAAQLQHGIADDGA